MNPQTMIVYFDKDIQALWEPRLKRISQLYSNAELTTVIVGMRRVFVYHINSQKFEESYEFLRKNNLVFFPIKKTGVYSGFSHRHMPVKKGEPFTLYGAAVRTDDQEAGELFTEYSNSSPVNHNELGKLLGYPKCCSDWFSEHWGKPSVDPMYEAAMNTIEDKSLSKLDMEHVYGVKVSCHPYANNLLRYFGLRITPHLPCSMQCKETIRWGEEWIDIMRQIDDEATDWLIELLSMPLIWDYNKGIAIIDTSIFRGITNSNTHLMRQRVVNNGYE